MLSFVPQWMASYIQALISVKEVVVGLVGLCAWVYGLYRKRFHDQTALLHGKDSQIYALEKKNKQLEDERNLHLSEVQRSSARSALAFVERESSEGNDGIVFDRLSIYLNENSREIAEICARLAKTRLIHAFATSQNNDLQEIFRLASAARYLDGSRKQYRELYEELGQRLTAQALTGDLPESQHDIYDWLNLRDVDAVRLTVSALRQEANNEVRDGRYTLGVTAAEAGCRLAKQRLSADDLARLACEFTFADTLRFAGELTKAETIARKAWQAHKSVLLPDHPDTLAAGYLVASILEELGRYVEAEKIARAIWDAEKSVLSLNHPHTLTAGYRVASILHHLERHGEAEEIARKVWDAQKILLPGDLRPLSTGHLVAQILLSLGRQVEAEEVARKIWDAEKALLGPDHPLTLAAGYLVAQILHDLGQHVEAEAIARQIWDSEKSVLSPNHPYTLTAGYLVASILKSLGRQVEAEEIARHAWNAQKSLLSQDHPNTRSTGFLLASILRDLGRDTEAEEIGS